jgi:hypothetical protein
LSGIPVASFERGGCNVSNRTYGILAGAIGSALGAWWWSRHRNTSSDVTPSVILIYDNTPAASDLSEGLI